MTKFHNVVNAVQFIRAVKVNGMKNIFVIS